jgi:hypothetical protein
MYIYVNIHICICIIYLGGAALGIELRASNLLGKHSTMHLVLLLLVLLFFR